MTFGRSEWGALRFNTSLALSDADVSALWGPNEPITSAEVADMYLPLTRLMGLHYAGRARTQCDQGGIFRSRNAQPSLHHRAGG